MQFPEGICEQIPQGITEGGRKGGGGERLDILEGQFGS